MALRRDRRTRTLKERARRWEAAASALSAASQASPQRIEQVLMGGAAPEKPCTAHWERALHDFAVHIDLEKRLRFSRLLGRIVQVHPRLFCADHLRPLLQVTRRRWVREPETWVTPVGCRRGELGDLVPPAISRSA